MSHSAGPWNQSWSSYRRVLLDLHHFLKAGAFVTLSLQLSHQPMFRNTIDLPLYEVSYFYRNTSNSFSYYYLIIATRLITPSGFLNCSKDHHISLKSLLSSIILTFRCFITSMLWGAKNDVYNYSTNSLVLPAMIYYGYIYGTEFKIDYITH